MKFVRVCVVLLSVALTVAFVFSCSSSEDDPVEEEVDYDCDGDVQTNTVEAAEWVRENTAIEQYTYESDPDADVVVLNLLDDSEASLGELTIEGFFGVPPEPDEFDEESVQHRVEATFAPAGDSQPLEVVSDSIVANTEAEEFRTRTLMQRGDDQVMVHSDFKAMDCYASEEPDGDASHPCAWPAPVFEPEFSVPTCGFDSDPALPAAPNLRRVEYRTPADADPGVGGYLYRSDGPEATFEPVGEGASVGDTAEIVSWLEASGADAIIGSDAEQLFSAAYADPVWMDHVEDHAAACLAEELEAAQSDLQTVRQPHHAPEFGCSPELQWNHLAMTSDIDVVRQAGGAEPCEECAEACGKPHLRTFDGSSFAFHAAGEFYLSKAEVGAPYAIQARVEPAASLSCQDDVEACQHITVVTAVAMKMGDVRVGLYRDQQPHLVINGEPVERVADADLSDLPEGARIHQRGDTLFRFDWPGGEGLDAAVREHYLDLHGILPVERFGQVAGLWGNFTNISSDDFKTRDGVIIEKPFSFDEFYDDFADSWRIETDESFFDYADGEDTSDFTIPELPEQEVSVDDIPEELRAEAEEACSGVTGHPDHNWCIFDVVCMCDEDMAVSTEDLGPHDAYTDMHPEAPLTVTGDLCMGQPESFEFQEAGEQTCPPETDPCIHVVREQSGVELTDELAVDAASAGTYDALDSLEAANIDAGTEVDSYLLHVNQVPEGTGRLTGEALCAEEILGVIVTDTGLTETDDLLGLPDESYDDGARSPDFDTDEFEILESGKGVRVNVNAEDGIREFRVVTRAAGE